MAVEEEKGGDIVPQTGRATGGEPDQARGHARLSPRGHRWLGGLLTAGWLDRSWLLELKSKPKPKPKPTLLRLVKG